MSEVNIAIGRRSYSISCGEGEEERVRMLGAEVDERLRRLGSNVSANDAKNILFAAIILADELQAARQASSSSGQTAAAVDPDLLKRSQILEEQLLEAREENERVHRHLANANMRLERLATARQPVKDESVVERAESLAALLEKCAARLESGVASH